MIILLLKNFTTYWWNSTTFPWLSMTTVNFHDFPGLENSFLKFHDFPGCVGTLSYPPDNHHNSETFLLEGMRCTVETVGLTVSRASLSDTWDLWGVSISVHLVRRLSTPVILPYRIVPSSYSAHLAIQLSHLTDRGPGSVLNLNLSEHDRHRSVLNIGARL